MESIQDINQMLLNGILPDSLNFKLQYDLGGVVDINKLKYNAFYRSYEFAESKFPKGIQGCDYMRGVVESCIPTLSPLEEYNLRVNAINDNGAFWGICYSCNAVLNDDHSSCDHCNKLFCDKCIEDKTIFKSSPGDEMDFCIECYNDIYIQIKSI
jgi:hypothetical protein